MAAVVERKVTLQRGHMHYVPNLYVMLVSHPGAGKSSSIERGTELIEDFREQFNPNLRIIPTQATEPAMVDMMKHKDMIQISPTLMVPQSAGYFYASEASQSALLNTHGDFIATLTGFYDCPKWFRNVTLSRGQFTIENVCMNMLAGCTFNYLATLVNEESVGGGFASRNIYVVSAERKKGDGKWEKTDKVDTRMRLKLMEDLDCINRIVGPMKPTEEWYAKFEKWEPDYQQYMIDLKSNRLESIMTRKGTAFIKLNILLALSESNSRVIEARHFDKASELIEDVYKDYPLIIAESVMGDKNNQLGMNQVLGQALKKNNGVMSIKALRSVAMANGNSVSMIKETIDFMASAGWIEFEGSNVKLLIDPDRHL
jgi:hypothetical protein